jgi:ATP-binding cassette subfamily B protein
MAFEHVNFAYPSTGEAGVLHDVSFVAEPGQTVAILGATGVGKTTLIELIPRFYDPTSGRITANGVDLRLLDPNELLAQIALVPQESILFSGTVADNIRYGRPDAPPELVEAAARAAQAHDFILGLPNGYDTHIEERGVNLSGGQKQRIAIARALLLHPAILILDDSTSAVDVETETKIHDALLAWNPGATVFLVAQRISTVLKADKILVLDGGRVAAEGTHRQLLTSSAIYQEIYDSQLGGEVEP